MTGSAYTTKAVTQTPFDERGGQFSPDGRWVVYETNESGRTEIVVQAFPESCGKMQVSVNGGIGPRWSQDGYEIYFIAPDATLMAASAAAASTSAHRLLCSSRTFWAVELPHFPSQLTRSPRMGASSSTRRQSIRRRLPSR
jgi:Tol biopolymer transport system component